jgi:hypothetical protein
LLLQIGRAAVYGEIATIRVGNFLNPAMRRLHT